MKIKGRSRKKKKAGRPVWFKPTKKEIEEVVEAGRSSCINPSAIIGGPVRKFLKPS